jgi:hypothetical protein
MESYFSIVYVVNPIFGVTTNTLLKTLLSRDRCDSAFTNKQTRQGILAVRVFSSFIDSCPSLKAFSTSTISLPCPILSLQRAPYVHFCLTASIPSYSNPFLLLLEKFLPKTLLTE